MLLHSGNTKDVFQLTVHLVHLISGERRQGVQEHCHSNHVLAGPGVGWVQRPLTVDGGGTSPGPQLRPW
jgi:hypothetical protein